MSDCVFTKETIPKSHIYTRIKALLIQAGWQNITSKPVTDFDVFTSSGESGDKALCFQMQDGYNGVSFSSGTSQYIGLRLIRSYTPGADGVAGTFGRPDETWRNLTVFKAAVPSDMVVDFYYHVNKNRISFAISPPEASGLMSHVAMIGMSNETCIDEKDSDGVLIASTSGVAANTVTITAKLGEKTNVGYSLAATPLVPNKEASPNDTRLISKIYYGNVYEGVRGFVDGIYTIMSDCSAEEYEKTCNGDILVAADGTTKYRVFMCHTGSYSSFGWHGKTPGYKVAVAIRVQ